MTLVIAFLLMAHIGDFSPLAYVGVVVVWVLHLGHKSN